MFFGVLWAKVLGVRESQDPSILITRSLPPLSFFGLQSERAVLIALAKLCPEDLRIGTQVPGQHRVPFLVSRMCCMMGGEAVFG